MSTLSEFIAMRPLGGFGLIMADPPWLYQLRSTNGEKKSPQAQYDCMSLEDICALPVSVIAADDCVLWLWATNPMLPQALDVIEAWGFEYKTAGTWVKRSKLGAKLNMGTGYVLRSANEPFLIATRGKPKTTRGTRSVVESGEARTADPIITIEAAIREHSRKPEEAFTAAEALIPDAMRIELFSRASRPGWKTWGNEAEKFDSVEVA